MSETDDSNPSLSAESSRLPQENPAGAPSRVWPVYALFVATLLGMMLASVVLVGVVWAMSGADGPPDPQELARLALRPDIFIVSIWVTGAVLVTASLSAAGLSPQPWRERLSLQSARVGVMPLILAAVGLPALSVVLETLVLAAGVEVTGSLKMITETISKMHGVQIPLVVFAISVVPGFSEELFFRGYVQTRLLRRYGALVGVLISSVLFGVMHMDPLHSALTALMGIYLGYVALRFGSVWPAVGAHTLNNGISAISIVFFPEQAHSTEPDFVSAAVALVVFGFCFQFGVLKLEPIAARAAAKKERSETALL